MGILDSPDPIFETHNDVPNRLSSIPDAQKVGAREFNALRTFAEEAKNRLVGTLNVFEAIPSQFRAGIEAHTSSVDVRGWIQDALSEAKTGLANYTQGGRLYLPPGGYNLGAPLTTYSGLEVYGAGQTTRLVATAGFSGAHLLTAAATPGGARPYVESLHIHDLGFVATGSVWAVDVEPLQSTIARLHFWTKYGLKFYGQGSHIEDLRNWGTDSDGMEQMLWLAGNYNSVRNVDKEGNTGTSTEPYIKIARHPGDDSPTAAVRIDGVLIENAVSANKAGIELDGAQNVTINDVWVEGSVYLPNVIHAYGASRNIVVSGALNYLVGGSQVIKVSGASEMTVELLDSDSDDSPLPDVVDVDATSRLTARNVHDRNGRRRFRLDETSLIARRGFSSSAVTAYPTTKISPWSEYQSTADGELLKNSSFEAGRYCYTINGTLTTEEYIPSEVGPGLMGHWVFSGGGGQILQPVTIPAAWVGRSMVFGAKVKAGGPLTVPIVDGCGIASGLAEFRVGDATSPEWEVISVSFVPTAAGTLNVGLYFLGGDATTDYYADDLYLSFGTIGRGMSPHTKEIDLGGVTLVAGTAAPVAGTWKVGDRVINSAPAVGQPKGWICTVAGSPGTWVSEGNL